MRGPVTPITVEAYDGTRLDAVVTSGGAIALSLDERHAVELTEGQTAEFLAAVEAQRAAVLGR